MSTRYDAELKHHTTAFSSCLRNTASIIIHYNQTHTANTLFSTHSLRCTCKLQGKRLAQPYDKALISRLQCHLHAGIGTPKYRLPQRLFVGWSRVSSPPFLLIIMKLHVFLIVIISLATLSSQTEAKVTITIDGAEISVVDKDQSTANEPTVLSFPNTLATSLEADQHQKVLFKFTIRNTANKEAIKAHQTFVQFSNKQTQKKVVLIAEASNSDSQYRLDLPVSTSASNFGHSSGAYDITLFVGDASISNPTSWNVGSIKLTFAKGGETGKSIASWMKQSYDPLPVITHEFRQPEKRPPSVVSDAFTVLAIIPLILLIGIWLKLGVNFSDFPFSLASLGFHTGLTLIFAIFFCFWTTMNMFTTLKCLSGVVLVTSISGHSLLKTLAAKKGH